MEAIFGVLGFLLFAYLLKGLFGWAAWWWDHLLDAVDDVRARRLPHPVSAFVAFGLPAFFGFCVWFAESGA